MSAAQSRVVADRYRLVEPLGQGGMGRVWMARDELLHRDVAIKELIPPPGLTEEERQEMRERTLREARAIARLSHPNVVRIFDILRNEGEPWIVMEYVRSRSLQEVLAQDGPLPARKVAEMGLGMLSALRAAHRSGVVHRDVKPGNVLLGDDGRVVLTDFGLATVPGDPVVTRTGLVLGSPAYISPERAHDGTAGPAADMWSLGATLYAAVEGQSPYARPSAIATLAALATEPPAPPRRAGPLKPVLMGLLRKDPAERIVAAEAERLLRRAAGRRSRSSVPLLPGARRPFAEGYLPAPHPSPGPAAPVVSAVAAVPPPRRPEVEPDKSDKAAVSGAPDQAESAAVPADEPSAEAPTGSGDGLTEEPENGERRDGVEADAKPTTLADEPAAPAEEPKSAAVVRAGPATSASRSVSAPKPASTPIGATAVGMTAVRPARGGARPAPLDRLRAVPVRIRGVVAAVVAVLVLTGLLVVTLSNEDEKTPASGPRTGAGVSASPSGAAGSSGGPTGSPGASSPSGQAPTPTPRPTGTNVVLPAGWHFYHDKSGFTVAVPKNWRVEHERTLVYFREQSGEYRVLGIDRSDSPKSDPVKDWKQQEKDRAYLKANYEKVAIRKVDYFLAAADWEYTYDQADRLHAINRGFVTGPRQAHAILWITPERTWRKNLDEFDLITRSFVPIPE